MELLYLILAHVEQLSNLGEGQALLLELAHAVY
jgi:hypothetical protein